MSVSVRAEPFLVDLWDEAISFAGVNPERFHLLPVDGAAVQGAPKAACYPPKLRLCEEPEDLLRGEALVEANDVAFRDKHRIAIYEDIDEDDPVDLAIAAAKLRHEIRHGEQRDTCGRALFELDEIADDLVAWRSSEAALYNQKPIELDANDAAARFLASRYPVLVASILATPEAPLVRRASAPVDMSELRAATVRFIFGLRDIVDRPGHPLDQSGLHRVVVDTWAPAQALWEDLEAEHTAG